MSRNTIVVSGDPKGHFMEGTLAAITPKPGTILSMKADGTWEAWNGIADGGIGEICVLREDEGQGKTVDDAYTSGAHFYGYFPLRGDELQVLYGNASGTADDVVVGDGLMIDDGTGKAIILTGTPLVVPFKALEAITDPVADQLVLVRMAV